MSLKGPERRESTGSKAVKTAAVLVMAGMTAGFVNIKRNLYLEQKNYSAAAKEQQSLEKANVGELRAQVDAGIKTCLQNYTECKDSVREMEDTASNDINRVWRELVVAPGAHTQCAEDELKCLKAIKNEKPFSSGTSGRWTFI